MWNLNNPYAEREENLKKLGFKSYRDYLRSPLWSELRKRVIKARGNKCEKCGSRRGIQIHHRSYDIATMCGGRLEMLTVACASCHYKAERPADFRRRSRYDRFRGASDELLKRMRNDANIHDLCERWYQRYAKWLPKVTDPRHRLAVLAKIRARASALDGVERCLCCDRAIAELPVPPKQSSLAALCDKHSWQQIRAYTEGVLLGMSKADRRMFNERTPDSHVTVVSSGV